VDRNDDQALLAQFRAGDREAFTELVIRYQRPIYNAALWIVRRAEDASDVTQTTFLKVVERADDYDPQYKFFSWLYRIAVNEALDLLRRRGGDVPLDDEFDPGDDGAGDPAARLGAVQLARELQRGLRRLSVQDRVVITLRHFSECSYDEIARILDLDEKTVKSRLFEARRRLRGMLHD
jgi:RNA polymerase sigma-70 factor (ECF subfamily)